jgi:hypothetical protein
LNRGLLVRNPSVHTPAFKEGVVKPPEKESKGSDVSYTVIFAGRPVDRT